MNIKYIYGILIVPKVIYIHQLISSQILKVQQQKESQNQFILIITHIFLYMEQAMEISEYVI